jgi:hypothetical protein
MATRKRGKKGRNKEKDNEEPAPPPPATQQALSYGLTSPERAEVDARLGFSAEDAADYDEAVLEIQAVEAAGRDARAGAQHQHQPAPAAAGGRLTRAGAARLGTHASQRGAEKNDEGAAPRVPDVSTGVGAALLGLDGVHAPPAPTSGTARGTPPGAERQAHQSNDAAGARTRAGTVVATGATLSDTRGVHTPAGQTRSTEHNAPGAMHSASPLNDDAEQQAQVGLPPAPGAGVQTDAGRRAPSAPLTATMNMGFPGQDETLVPTDAHTPQGGAAQVGRAAAAPTADTRARSTAQAPSDTQGNTDVTRPPGQSHASAQHDLQVAQGVNEAGHSARVTVDGDVPGAPPVAHRDVAGSGQQRTDVRTSYASVSEVPADVEQEAARTAQMAAAKRSALPAARAPFGKKSGKQSGKAAAEKHASLPAQKQTGGKPAAKQDARQPSQPRQQGAVAPVPTLPSRLAGSQHAPGNAPTISGADAVGVRIPVLGMTPSDDEASEYRTMGYMTNRLNGLSSGMHMHSSTAWAWACIVMDDAVLNLQHFPSAEHVPMHIRVLRQYLQWHGKLPGVRTLGTLSGLLRWAVRYWNNITTDTLERLVHIVLDIAVPDAAYSRLMTIIQSLPDLPHDWLQRYQSVTLDHSGLIVMGAPGLVRAIDQLTPQLDHPNCPLIHFLLYIIVHVGVDRKQWKWVVQQIKTLCIRVDNSELAKVEVGWSTVKHGFAKPVEPMAEPWNYVDLSTRVYRAEGRPDLSGKAIWPMLHKYMVDGEEEQQEIFPAPPPAARSALQPEAPAEKSDEEALLEAFRELNPGMPLPARLARVAGRTAPQSAYLPTIEHLPPPPPAAHHPPSATPATRERPPQRTDYTTSDPAADMPQPDFGTAEPAGHRGAAMLPPQLPQQARGGATRVELRDGMVLVNDIFPAELLQQAVGTLSNGALQNLLREIRPQVPWAPTAVSAAMAPWMMYLMSQMDLSAALDCVGPPAPTMRQLAEVLLKLLREHMQPALHSLEQMMDSDLDYTGADIVEAAVVAVRGIIPRLQHEARSGRSHARSQQASDRSMSVRAAQEAARQAEEAERFQAEQEAARQAQQEAEAEAARIAAAQRAREQTVRRELELLKAQMESKAAELMAVQAGQAPRTSVFQRLGTPVVEPEAVRFPAHHPVATGQATSAARRLQAPAVQTARTVVREAGGADPNDPSDSDSDQHSDGAPDRRAEREEGAAVPIGHKEWSEVATDGSRDMTFRSFVVAEGRPPCVTTFTKVGPRVSDPNLRHSTELMAPNTHPIPTLRLPDNFDLRSTPAAWAMLHQCKSYQRNRGYLGDRGNTLVSGRGVPHYSVDELIHLFPKWAVDKLTAAGYHVADRMRALHPDEEVNRDFARNYLSWEEVIDIITAGGAEAAKRTAKRALKTLRYDSRLPWTANIPRFEELNNRLNRSDRQKYNAFQHFIQDHPDLFKVVFGVPGRYTLEPVLPLDAADATAQWSELQAVCQRWQNDVDAANERRDRAAQEVKDAMAAVSQRAAVAQVRPDKRRQTDLHEPLSPASQAAKPPKKPKAQRSHAGSQAQGELQLTYGNTFEETVAHNPHAAQPNPQGRLKVPKRFTTQAVEAGKCHFCLGDFHGTTAGCTDSAAAKAASLQAYRRAQEVSRANNARAGQRQGATAAHPSARQDEPTRGRDQQPRAATAADRSTYGGRSPSPQGGRSSHPLAQRGRGGRKSRSRSKDGRGRGRGADRRD